MVGKTGQFKATATLPYIGNSTIMALNLEVIFLNYSAKNAVCLWP